MLFVEQIKLPNFSSIGPGCHKLLFFQNKLTLKTSTVVMKFLIPKFWTWIREGRIYASNKALKKMFTGGWNTALVTTSHENGSLCQVTRFNPARDVTQLNRIHRKLNLTWPATQKILFLLILCNIRSKPAKWPEPLQANQFSLAPLSSPPLPQHMWKS